MHAMLVLLATVILNSNPPKDAYIISTGDNSTFSTNVDVLRAVRRRIPARSVWMRRGGQEYLIVDETLVRRAEALFAPEMALGPQQDAVGREESRLDHQIDALEDKEDRLSADEERNLSDLRAQMRDVEDRERELDRKEERLEREAERQLWPLLDDAIRAGLAKRLTR